MVNSCSAYNCTARYSNGCGLSFHLFPKDSERRNKWVDAMKRSNFKPSSSSILCSKHFEPSCYIKRFGQIKLSDSAIPTIFNFTRNLRKTHKVIRILKRARESVAQDVELKANNLCEGNQSPELFRTATTKLRNQDGLNSMNEILFVPVNSFADDNVDDNVTTETAEEDKDCKYLCRVLASLTDLTRDELLEFCKLKVKEGSKLRAEYSRLQKEKDNLNKTVTKYRRQLYQLASALDTICFSGSLGTVIQNILEDIRNEEMSHNLPFEPSDTDDVLVDEVMIENIPDPLSLNSTADVSTFCLANLKLNAPNRLDTKVSTSVPESNQVFSKPVAATNPLKSQSNIPLCLERNTDQNTTADQPGLKDAIKNQQVFEIYQNLCEFVSEQNSTSATVTPSSKLVNSANVSPSSKLKPKQQCLNSTIVSPSLKLITNQQTSLNSANNSPKLNDATLMTPSTEVTRDGKKPVISPVSALPFPPYLQQKLTKLVKSVFFNRYGSGSKCPKKIAITISSKDGQHVKLKAKKVKASSFEISSSDTEPRPADAWLKAETVTPLHKKNTSSSQTDIAKTQTSVTKNHVADPQKATHNITNIPIICTKTSGEKPTDFTVGYGTTSQQLYASLMCRAGKQDLVRLTNTPIKTDRKLVPVAWTAGKSKSYNSSVINKLRPEHSLSAGWTANANKSESSSVISELIPGDHLSAGWTASASKSDNSPVINKLISGDSLSVGWTASKSGNSPVIDKFLSGDNLSAGWTASASKSDNSPVINKLISGDSSSEFVWIRKFISGDSLSAGWTASASKSDNSPVINKLITGDSLSAGWTASASKSDNSPVTDKLISGDSLSTGWTASANKSDNPLVNNKFKPGDSLSSSETGTLVDTAAVSIEGSSDKSPEYSAQNHAEYNRRANELIASLTTKSRRWIKRKKYDMKLENDPKCPNPLDHSYIIVTKRKPGDDLLDLAFNGSLAKKPATDTAVNTPQVVLPDSNNIYELISDYEKTLTAAAHSITFDWSKIQLDKTAQECEFSGVAETTHGDPDIVNVEGALEPERAKSIITFSRAGQACVVKRLNTKTPSNSASRNSELQNSSVEDDPLIASGNSVMRVSRTGQTCVVKRKSRPSDMPQLDGT